MGQVRLSIVDFLGIALPGLVWALLVLSLFEVLGWTTITKDPWPISIVTALIDAENKNGGGDSPLSSLYVFLVVFGILLGYVQRSFGNAVVERITRIGTLRFWLTKCGRLSIKEIRSLIKSHQFPYKAVHCDCSYYEKLEKMVESIVGADSAKLGEQPFSGCRRALRLYAPALWEETEYREAQIRLLGSLLLASLFSLAASGLKIWLTPDFRNTGLKWAALSLVAAIVFSLGFRSRRTAEVRYVYLNTLVAFPFIRTRRH